MLPFIEIFGIEIPMYGLCMSTAIGLALILSCVRAKRRGHTIDDLLTIALIAVVCGLIGSKLLYVLVTYSPKEIMDHLRAEGLSFIINAGLVFYGALICGVAGAFLGAAICKRRLADYCDAIVPTLPLAHAVGRLGCFFSGCCYGKATDSWIGMCFPHSVSGLSPDVRVIPTQLIESGANVLVFLFLLWFTRKRRKGFTTLFVYMMIYAVVRFIIEFLRGDEIRGILWGLSTSQWISIALFIAGAVGLALTASYYKKHPHEVHNATPEAVFEAEAGNGDADGANEEEAETEPEDSGK